MDKEFKSARTKRREVCGLLCVRERDPLFKFRKNAPLIISGFNWPRGIIGPN
jgi:hypothetical protein